MANTKSAEKRNRQAQKRRSRNIVVRDGIKDAVKEARSAITQKDPAKVTEALRAAAKTLNQAATKGVVKKRAASRRISRLDRAAYKAAQA